MGLKAMREDAGLSQQELCHAIGCSAVGRVWSWEAWDQLPRPKSARNPRIMRFEMAKRMADALGLSLDDFWAGLSD
ncbi:helix-turn-helix domain-containing protein [Bifidobacterium adolescentis]|jgi:DNA-binding transcriptional regulator YiaG|uniref:helix-turn-helix domain-containing protein n=1 Tax=Bifidobacterium adolescentis TaxID=1680 RepID=UPI0022E5D6A6|nr:helix-turn-helix transcriptional regulator [Bifidobacterium adolescentis]